MFQHASCESGFAIDITGVGLGYFGDFKTGIYNPEIPITSWQVKLPSHEDALQAWKKHMRPNPKDYQTFSNENNWIRFKAHFLQLLTHICAHSLCCSTLLLQHSDIVLP